MAPPGDRWRTTNHQYRPQTGLEAASARLRAVARTLDQRTGAARALAEAGRRLTTDITELREQVETHEHAAHLLASIGEQRQGAAQAQIENLVTQGLHTIFGTDLSFHLVPTTRAKTPVVDFIVRSALPDGTTLDTDVLDARGGGLAATVGFLLRLVVLLLRRTAGSVLFLDETFAHVSAEYEPRLAEFLAELVDKTGVQIVLVTHSDAYTEAADTRYRFDLHQGLTRVRPA
jgi:DNA repair exonuclease SbcCD ATPase subunit